ncbi:MAG: hypothetical protein IJT83_06785 [Victivallales bacterium]|nr:hypothetical protein [Victivallales bacterium]
MRALFHDGVCAAATPVSPAARVPPLRPRHQLGTPASSLGLCSAADRVWRPPGRSVPRRLETLCSREDGRRQIGCGDGVSPSE